jgi:hypothetical protein
MKKTLLSIILPLLFITTSKSQVIPNNNFNGGIKAACDFNSSHIIYTFKEWEGYQTYDSLWWGLRDTASCFDIADTANSNHYGKIYYDEVNKNESVFIHSRLTDSTTIALDTNQIYQLSLDFLTSTGDYSLIDTSGNCPDNLCSGLQIGIQIPDSFGTGKTMRWYSGKLKSGGFGGTRFESCFPTEKFVNGNNLRELIIKYTTTGTIPAGFNIQPYSINIEYPYYVQQLRSIDAYNKVSNRHYEAYLAGFEDYLLMYTDTTYPSPAHQSYVDAQPNPNTLTQDTVDVIVDYSSFLSVQPYTQLRGGLISGSTTLRHTVNLINYGDMCIPFIDVVMQDGNNFIYRSGNVEMAGEKTCMQFTKGSKLIVDENAVFNYGIGGQGILAITTGGTIEIRKNAEFVIHNTLAINEGRGYATPQQIYMTLNPGSKLTFVQGSHINNKYSIDHKMRLNIYMKGGVLDDSGLPESERYLINCIYDSPLEELQANLRIYGNPFSDRLLFSFLIAEQANFRASLYSIDGKLIETNDLTAQRGINYYDWDMNFISNGIYLLKIETDAGTVSARILKMKIK